MRLASRNREADAFLVELRRLLETPRFPAEPEFQRGMDRALDVPGMFPPDSAGRSQEVSETSPSPSRQLGPYRLLEKLARGGWGPCTRRSTSTWIASWR